METIVVYQMARVASSTVFFALSKALPGVPSFVCPTNNKKDREKEPTGKRLYHAHYYNTFSENLKSRVKKGKVRVITLVRDPLRRNLSAYFQQWKTNQLGKLSKRKVDKALLDRIRELFVKHGKNEMYPQRWFNKELRGTFGIDVFQYPFDKERGYEIINTDMVDVLILKAERLNKVFPVAVQEFMGLRIEDWERKIKVDKRKVYKTFLNQVQFSPGFVEKMFDTKYVKHFYTADEIESLKRRWIG